jgi:hypothetical protein
VHRLELETLDRSGLFHHAFRCRAKLTTCAACVRRFSLDVDPVALMRRRDGGSLRQYVNDRPSPAEPSDGLEPLTPSLPDWMSSEWTLAQLRVPTLAFVYVLGPRVGRRCLRVAR